MKLQYKDVEKIQFFQLSKIEEELKKYLQKYVPHGDYWFDVIAELKKKIQNPTKPYGNCGFQGFKNVAKFLETFIKTASF